VSFRWVPHVLAVCSLGVTSCGGEPDAVVTGPTASASNPASTVPRPNVSLRSSRDQEGRVCFALDASEMGGEPLEDCRSTEGTGFFVAVAATPLVSEDSPTKQWATIYIMDEPYVVTEVSQAGQPVPWLQAEGALVVISGGVLGGDLDTQILFDLGTYHGKCNYEQVRESCAIDINE
jgi:hypothetical protein